MPALAPAYKAFKQCVFHQIRIQVLLVLSQNLALTWSALKLPECEDFLCATHCPEPSTEPSVWKVLSQYL